MSDINPIPPTFEARTCAVCDRKMQLAFYHQREPAFQIECREASCSIREEYAGDPPECRVEVTVVGEDEADE